MIRIAKTSIFLGILLISIFVIFTPGAMVKNASGDLVVDVKAKGSVFKETTPAETVTFEFELENLGDEMTKVTCKVLSNVPEGWEASFPGNGEILLDAAGTGGEKHTISLAIKPSYGIGYHDEIKTFQVSFTPTNIHDSSLKGNEVILYVTVKAKVLLQPELKYFW